MSDETHPTALAQEPTANDTENHSPALHVDHQPDEQTRSTISSPLVVLSFVIIALLGALVALMVKNGGFMRANSAEDVRELEARARVLRDDYSRQRIAMGLSPLAETKESVSDVTTRLKNDADLLAAMVGDFQNMLATKEAELTAGAQKLLEAEQTSKLYSDEAARLRGELQKALIAASDIDRLRSELESVKAQRDALSAELAKKGSASAELLALQEDLRTLQGRYDEARARIAELEAELAKGRLFANSERELLPAAVELFQKLRKLEGKTDSEISSAYSECGVRLGAYVMQSLKFPTGSSELSEEDKTAIRSLVPEVADGDLLFVVGYASKTGNVDANRELSSDRATTVAEFFNGEKRPGQKVQAVYLGQTDRFSSRLPERNQIVELWKIAKR